jgi:acyl-CoA thioesterase-1
VVLLGVRMPPSYGERYTLRFAAMYPELAHRHHAGMVPFLLEGVADRPTLIRAMECTPASAGRPFCWIILICARATTQKRRH